MQAADIFVGILFLFIGCFSLLAAVRNWDWFFRSVNASVFIRWLGRKGARYVYGVVGLIVIIIGILMLSGTIK